MTDEVLVAARGLNRYYGNQQALHDVDITLRRGEVLGFLGLNGAGKTTAMKILAGALRPHGGAVEICGTSLAANPLQTKNPSATCRKSRPCTPRCGRTTIWSGARASVGCRATRSMLQSVRHVPNAV